MGGLVVERALLDNKKLAERISHLFLFGAPSGGLSKARPFVSLKRQIRDMESDGPFITSLRRDWDAGFPRPMKFFFRTVAGDRDEFVPASSSIEPFPDEFRAVVPGNHLEIVKPVNSQHQSFALVVDALVGGPKKDGRMWMERGSPSNWVISRKRSIPCCRMPDCSTAATTYSLALALEGLGRDEKALSVLEKHFKGGTSSTDAQGILAGRLKRRWLVGRVQSDLDRAKELYSDALRRSEAKEDHSQAYYHAINVAFLDLISTPPNSDVPKSVDEMARRARRHCSQASQTQWRFATEAEASLMLGDLDGAEALYRRAAALTGSQARDRIRCTLRPFGPLRANSARKGRTGSKKSSVFGAELFQRAAP